MRHAPVENQLPDLEDMTPYEVTLQSVEYCPPTEQHPDYGAQLKFIWQLSEDENDTLWTYAGISFGRSRTTGTPARMVQILNALCGKPAQTAVLGLDDDSWTVEYANGETIRLQTGTRITILGHRKETENGARFIVDMYGPPKKGQRVAAAAPAQEPVAAGDIPF